MTIELKLVPGGKSLVFVNWIPACGKPRRSPATGAPPTQFAPLVQFASLPRPDQILLSARVGAGVRATATSASKAPRTADHRLVGRRSRVVGSQGGVAMASAHAAPVLRAG